MFYISLTFKQTTAIISELRLQGQEPTRTNDCSILNLLQGSQGSLHDIINMDEIF